MGSFHCLHRSLLLFLSFPFKHARTMPSMWLLLVPLGLKPSADSAGRGLEQICCCRFAAPTAAAAGTACSAAHALRSSPAVLLISRSGARKAVQLAAWAPFQPVASAPVRTGVGANHGAALRISGACDGGRRGAWHGARTVDGAGHGDALDVGGACDGVGVGGV
eukprot:scaffold238494_cov20-Tisochrysis_lutea.AAC.2